MRFSSTRPTRRRCTSSAASSLVAGEPRSRRHLLHGAQHAARRDRRHLHPPRPEPGVDDLRAGHAQRACSARWHAGATWQRSDRDSGRYLIQAVAFDPSDARRVAPPRAAAAGSVSVQRQRRRAGSPSRAPASPPPGSREVSTPPQDLGCSLRKTGPPPSGGMPMAARRTRPSRSRTTATRSSSTACSSSAPRPRRSGRSTAPAPGDRATAASSARWRRKTRPCATYARATSPRPNSGASRRIRGIRRSSLSRRLVVERHARAGRLDG